MPGPAVSEAAAHIWRDARASKPARRLLTRSCCLPYTSRVIASGTLLRAAAAAAALAVLPKAAGSETRATEAAKVVWVTDGDTITVRIGPRKEKVRLLGIDAPELKEVRKPLRDLAWDARDHALRRLKGRIVTLERDRLDRDRDDYGRLLRYVFLGDGTNINEEMVREGYARVYRRGNFELRSRFLAAEEQARRRGLGLWALPADIRDARRGERGRRSAAR